MDTITNKHIDPETGIWDITIAKKRHKFDIDLAFAIYKMIGHKCKSVADVGCGDGRYCAFLKGCGIADVIGYEGTKNIITLGVYSQIITADITKPLNSAPKDLVLFLEVAEHVPQQHEEMLIRNVVSLTGKILVMSWAPKEQYSVSGHVNPKSYEEAKNIMQSFGLVYLTNVTKELKNRAKFSWFKTNLMVFSNKNSVI